MATDFTTLTWNEALREFLLHLQATRAAKTHRFYETQLRQMVKWAEANDVAYTSFGKRHLDRYLVDRAQRGVSQTTLHHDAVVAKRRSEKYWRSASGWATLGLWQLEPIPPI